MLTKDRSPELNDIDQSDCYSITLLSQKEYSDTINEFLWLSLYVAKGIIRNELCYAKYFMDHHEIDLICKMLSWKIGTDNSYPVSLGKTYKYLKRYLSESEMNAFALLYSNGDFCEIREKLLYSIDYFKAISIYVAEKMNYNVDIDQMNKVKEYVENLHLKIV